MASPVLVLLVVEGVVLVVSLEPLELLADGFFVAVGLLVVPPDAAGALLGAALAEGVAEAAGAGVVTGSLVSEVVVPSVFANGVAVAVGKPSL
jgi:hydrogenase maturation factor